MLALTNLYQRAASLHVPVILQDMVTAGALKGAFVVVVFVVVFVMVFVVVFAMVPLAQRLHRPGRRASSAQGRDVRLQDRAHEGCDVSDLHHQSDAGTGAEAHHGA